MTGPAGDGQIGHLGCDQHHTILAWLLGYAMLILYHKKVPRKETKMNTENNEYFEELYTEMMLEQMEYEMDNYL